MSSHLSMNSMVPFLPRHICTWPCLQGAHNSLLKFLFTYCGKLSILHILTWAWVRSLVKFPRDVWSTYAVQPAKTEWSNERFMFFSMWRMRLIMLSFILLLWISNETKFTLGLTLMNYDILQIIGRSTFLWQPLCYYLMSIQAIRFVSKTMMFGYISNANVTFL